MRLLALFALGCGGLEPLSDTASDDVVFDDDTDPIDESWPLRLTVDMPDGECADLARSDRGEPVVTFLAEGPPNTTVVLWADKPHCGVDAFEYREIALDADGYGAVDIEHHGSTSCSETLLGRWRVWLADDTQLTPFQDVKFANPWCADADDCDTIAEYCPPEEDPVEEPVDEPLVPADQLFVLTASERVEFTPPSESWIDFGGGYESWPLERLWRAFDEGRPPEPLDAGAGPNSWYQADGTGSQNHALLWLGESALGHAFTGDVAAYDDAAERCLQVLALDTEQGHMRHEALGQYAGFWEGGIATMALAGFYAPEGSAHGEALLEASRAWWADHVAALRRLAMPDGQVALVGARMPGEPGTEDSWASLSAAVNLQLLDPRPHSQLHPTLASLVTAGGDPATGTGGVPVRWYRPRHVAERWIVLRAVQSGALPPVPADHPAPSVISEVYRWTEGGRTHVAAPSITGYRPVRWEVSWTSGGVITVEVGDPSDATGGKGPHSHPDCVVPGGATRVLGP